MANIQIYTARQHDTAIVAAEGQLDVTGAPVLGDALASLLREGSTQGIVLDLGGISLVDSSGLAALVAGLKLARTHDLWLSLASLGPELRQLLRRTNLDRVFDIRGSVDEALAVAA